ncbi:MAG: hypothetical protein PHX98_03640, partial [Candidatus Moranbacteria bacterium]|nr:hypothetical protein [Candidatus Moranbacteria bacterium]
FILFLFLSFFKEKIFIVWSKFAKIYLPIAAILIFITPDSTGSIFLDLDKEMATWFLAAIFLISSLGIIIYKSFKKQ